MFTKNIQQALELLRDDNLIWSKDFEDIRLELANLILVSAANGEIMASLADTLAKKIVYADKGTVFNQNLEKR